MESKRRSSTPKASQKQHSTSKSKPKKSASPALRDSKTKLNHEVPGVAHNLKKKTGQQLAKKKI
jgi:hypothetical protein